MSRGLGAARAGPGSGCLAASTSSCLGMAAKWQRNGSQPPSSPGAPRRDGRVTCGLEGCLHRSLVALSCCRCSLALAAARTSVRRQSKAWAAGKGAAGLDGDSPVSNRGCAVRAPQHPWQAAGCYGTARHRRAAPAPASLQLSCSWRLKCYWKWKDRAVIHPRLYTPG